MRDKKFEKNSAKKEAQNANRKVLFLKEFVDFFWKQYYEMPEKEKSSALKKVKDVINKNIKNIKEKENKIFLLKELKRVLFEELNLKKDLNIDDIKKLKEIIISLVSLSKDYIENYYLLEEFKGFLWDLKLKSKDKNQEHEIIEEIDWCLRFEYKIISSSLKKGNWTYEKIKKILVELIGFCYARFNAATSDNEKVFVLKDYLKTIKKIKKEVFYDDLIEQIKDLSHSVMQWCDELYLKNNLELRFLKSSKKNVLKKENSRIIRIRNEFAKNIIYYWDKSLSNASPKKQGYGTHDAVILDVKFFSNDKEKKLFRTNEEFTARIHYKAKKAIRAPMFGVAIYSSEGFLITGPNTTFSDKTKKIIKGEGYVYFKIKKLPLLQGRYLFSASIYDYTGRIPLDHHHQHYVFYVANDFSKLKEKYGLLSLEHDWNYKEK
ncbi:MAG: Wzt carbohydrate-binding domain-containing protein [Candidatus Woesearchaeota archaeon]